MTYLTEFPDFDPATMPAIPAGFDDVSWHNDACPSFLNEALGLIIFVDFADADKREFPETERFTLGRWDNGNTGNDVCSSDDWGVITAAAESEAATHAMTPVRSILAGLAALADDATRKRFLTATYVALVGYDPFDDDETATISSVAELICEVMAEHVRESANEA